MEFEWNKAKASSNFKKHHVTFDEASTVFGDSLARIFDDAEQSTEERREIIVGHSILGRLLLVCFTEREADVIRIFSARESTGRERQAYEENRDS
jgi:uncharacterized DUF497 family protein